MQLLLQFIQSADWAKLYVVMHAIFYSIAAIQFWSVPNTRCANDRISSPDSLFGANISIELDEDWSLNCEKQYAIGTLYSILLWFEVMGSQRSQHSQRHRYRRHSSALYDRFISTEYKSQLRPAMANQCIG